MSEQEAIKAMELWASGVRSADENTERLDLPCCIRPWEPRVGDLVIAGIGSECPPDRHLWTQDSPAATDEAFREMLTTMFGAPPKVQDLPAVGYVVAIYADWNEPDDDGAVTDMPCHHYYVDDAAADFGEPAGRWKKVSDYFAASELRLVCRGDTP